ncbi:MAG TPA: hypothetical protein VK176_06265 [Phycisphaerales bacterium]|nr:hypothetical protein [Phycisphaerales bacterium]
MSNDFELVVRRTTRHDVSLRARVVPTQGHAAAIRLAQSVVPRGGMVEVDLLDFSGGGVGLMSMVFFPRRTCLRLVIQGLREGEPELLDAVVRVQRVVMSDRRPAYMIGTSFESLNETSSAQVEAILDRLDGLDAPGTAAAPSAGEQH